MSLREWDEKEIKILKDKYPKMGPRVLSTILKGRTPKSIINKANRLKIKFNKKKAFCADCGTEVYPYSQKKISLCRSCAAKRTYSRLGPPNKDNIFNSDEIFILKKEYFDIDLDFLSIILGRSKSSIIKKASRLGIKRNPVYQHIYGVRYFTENNPMKNPRLKQKAIDSLKKGYSTGKIKINGAALRSKMGLTKKENHPNWRGGISFEPYSSNWDDYFKEMIRIRDNRRCLSCGIEEIFEVISGRRLCIHHIDYNKKNTYPNNCVSLCNSCHAKTNYNRKYWINYFRNIIK